MKNVIKKVRAADLPADEAKSAVKDARGTAKSVVKDVRKGARGQYVRARVAAARATASRRTRTRTDKRAVAAAGAAGAAGAYFLDPNDGARRRHKVRDRAVALLRRGKERARPENGAPNDESPPHSG